MLQFECSLRVRYKLPISRFCVGIVNILYLHFLSDAFLTATKWSTHHCQFPEPVYTMYKHTESNQQIALTNETNS